MLGSTLKRLTLTKISRDGEPVATWAVDPNSFTNKMSAIMAVQMSPLITQPPVNDITGTQYALDTTANVFDVEGRSAVNGPGVVFGSSSTGFTHQQDDLQSRFTSNVSYNTGSVNYSQGSSQSDVNILRTITNNTGSDITVKEAGLIGLANTSSSGTQFFLLARDVVGSSVTLADGESLQGTYTLRYD